MFGTPVGYITADQENRRDEAHWLDVQKTLGELAAQPDHQALLRAQAGHLNAETNVLKSQASDQAQLANIAQLIAGKAERGEIATTDDLKDGVPKTPADYYERLFKLSVQNNMSPVVTEKLANTTALLRQRDAQVNAAQSTQQLNQIKIMKDRLEMRGSFAAAALQAGPGQWAQMRQAAVDRTPPGQPSELDSLPQDWYAAQPVLRAAVNEAVSGKDQLELMQKRILDAAHIKRWDSANAKDTAAVELAGKRGEFIDVKTGLLKKNGGSASAEAKAAQAEMANSRRAIREAKDRKEFPRAPLAPEDRELGQTYTAANGAKFLWTKNPATGKGAAVMLAPPSGTQPSATTSVVPPNASTPDDSADDYEED